MLGERILAVTLIYCRLARGVRNGLQDSASSACSAFSYVAKCNVLQDLLFVIRMNASVFSHT